MLFSPSDDPKDWKYRRRHTVLGHWRKIKQDLYDEYVGREIERFSSPVEEEVPF